MAALARRAKVASIGRWSVLKHTSVSTPTLTAGRLLEAAMKSIWLAPLPAGSSLVKTVWSSLTSRSANVFVNLKL